MDTGFVPSPENMMKAMRAAERLVMTLDEKIGYDFGLFGSLEEVGGKTPWMWRAPKEVFLSEVANRFSGWDVDTTSDAIGIVRSLSMAQKNHKSLSSDDIQVIVVAARRVYDVALAADNAINSDIKQAHAQRARAIAAGKSRQPLTPAQQATAVADIRARMCKGDALQTACKSLVPKYGVSYRTLKRYFEREGQS